MIFKESEDTKVLALGGLGEVGKNMYVVMHKNEIIIIDSGVSFPEGELMGIDYIIPDFNFLKKNEKSIKALIITHGHEDHVGSIPFLLQMVNIPYIYAPNQAAALIRKKLGERNIQYKNLIVYKDDTKIKFKSLAIEFFRTNHSIPDSHGLFITTPDGTIAMTGDFKFDLTPIGPFCELHKMAYLGRNGVTLMLSDSTNALNEGFSASESRVDEALGDVFNRVTGRIIIATFASNIYRLKHIVDTCRRSGRKIATFGRSMEQNLDISIECGYIKNRDIFVSPEEANRLPDDKICLLCTGSQGEPLAALSRIADGSHRQIKLKPTDIVIFSSSAIPGNALSISRTINKLYLKGVKVYTNTSLNDVHTSGHAYEDELKLMIRLFKPKFFMPYHGEYRMLRRHADLAIECSVEKENTFVLENGEILSMSKGIVKRDGYTQAGDTYVDGNRIGESGNAVMKDRKTMATDGIIIVISNIDVTNKKLLGIPNITTRGFIMVNDNPLLIKEIEEICKNTIDNRLKEELNYTNIKNDIIINLTNFVFEKIGRKPIVLPVIMDIKK